MFLSQCELNFRHPAARRDLASPYDMHRTLAKVLHQTEAEMARYLWRLDRQEQTQRLLIQSHQEPDWSQLPNDGYLRRAGESTPLNYWERLQAGQIFAFALKANPTVRRDGKRLGLNGLEAQMTWLQQQGTKRGFELVGAMVRDSQLEQYRKGKDEGAAIQVLAVRYEGHLKIVDPALFREALAQGLGHAKAFGCGLLTLARA